MGKIKEAIHPSGLYDYYMDKELEGLPLAAIPEVQSYMRRHWIEYLGYIDLMEPSSLWYSISEDEYLQRNFLVYKIHQDIESPNIGLVLSAIYDYITEHLMELDIEGYWEWFLARE